MRFLNEDECDDVDHTTLMPASPFPLDAMQTELTKLGIRCETTDSSITIWPGALKPGLVKTYDDHRIAMGFTLLGLRSPGIVIDDPACCRKTFENYYEVLEKALCISPTM